MANTNGVVNDRPWWDPVRLTPVSAIDRLTQQVIHEVTQETWRNTLKDPIEQTNDLVFDAKGKHLPDGKELPKGKHLPQGKQKVQFASGQGWKWKPGAYLSSQEGPTDDQWMELGRSEKHFLVGSAEVDVTNLRKAGKTQLEAHLIDSKLEFACVSLTRALFDNTPKPLPSAEFEFAAPLPLAARVGDPTTHGTPLGPGIGSPDVHIGGLPAWRGAVDLHACPHVLPVAHGLGQTTPNGVTDVFINGFPAARAGDLVVEPAGGPNAIVGGCPMVLVGRPAPPVTCVVPPPPPKDDRWFRLKLLQQIDGGYLRGEGKLSLKPSEAESLRPKALGLNAKAEAVASLVRGRYVGHAGIKVPYTDYVYSVAFDVALHFPIHRREVESGKSWMAPASLPIGLDWKFQSNWGPA